MAGGVLIVGGGIAGVQAALDLADSGVQVTILENSSALGGRMSQLDKTFPTNDCAMCILSPKLVDAGRHPNIHLLTNSELLSVEGGKGDFRVRILKHPRYVNKELCVACGICAEKCPQRVPNEFDFGRSERKAIYRKFPQAIPTTFIIDKDNCTYFRTGKCKACEKFCEAKAIDFSQKEEEITLNVESIILAFGAKPFDARIVSQYHYGIFPNVITSLELERMLSASGPTSGVICRPSDGKTPDKIAFIQCVGSRNVVYGHPYCSSICCMYALKEAIDAHEHHDDIETCIFCTDMRAYGKEFEDYRIRAEDEYGVRIVRNNRISAVDETLRGNDLILYYSENGEIKEEIFNLVVLSVGLEPVEDIVELAEMLGVSLNEFRFCKTSLFAPVETNVPGISVCGLFQGPKDIPDTVSQASGAASLAGSIATRTTISGQEKELPQERDVRGEEPRTGVFVCHCGLNIAGVVNVQDVVEYAKKLPNVVYAEDNIYTCSLDTQKRMRETIAEHNLNRVIVASCSPRSYEKLFQETIREASLNPYLFEMANIREHCSWVHPDDPKAATEKAKKLVQMAVAKVNLHEPLERETVPVTKSALVVGGGISGMVASLEISRQGFEVHLVEKTDRLGGNMRRVATTVWGEDPIAFLKKTEEACRNDPNIRLHLNTEIESFQGFVGNFHTRLIDGSEIDHGVTILATGAIEYKPTEYLYGDHPSVITQLDLEQKLVSEHFNPREVVIIQCVGSRTDDYPNCSRICCTQSMKNALELKERYPECSVYVVFRDIRTYGFKETYYKQAGEKGVVFLRYDEENPPIVRKGDTLEVVVKESFLNEEVMMTPDYVVLNAAVRPNPDNEKLSEIFKVPLSKYGFFLEAHAKLRPVDFATDGIFLCGLAQGPKFTDENISQAMAVAARAMTILSKDTLQAEATIAVVDQDKCRGCGKCVETCEFNAPELVVLEDGRKVSQITEALCKGCGACSVACCNKSIQMRGFTSEQIDAMMKKLVERAKAET